MLKETQIKNPDGFVNQLIECMSYYGIMQLLEHFEIDAEKLAEYCHNYPDLKSEVEKRYPNFTIPEYKEKKVEKKPEPKAEKLEIKTK